MFGHRTEGLAPRSLYFKRIAINLAIATSFLGLSLTAGVMGYRLTEGMPWIDALLNASMIMGGMGPVDSLKTFDGKLFASIYALYCGIALILTAGIILTPVVHRVLHRFHLEDAETDSKNGL